MITNASKGEVIYNQNDVNKLVRVHLQLSKEIKDYINKLIMNTTKTFITFYKTVNISDIALYYDTLTHSNTDNVQIFIDKGEQQVRPFDFGTDAIERNRANPLSMLDADFEYGPNSPCGKP